VSTSFAEKCEFHPVELTVDFFLVTLSSSILLGDSGAVYGSVCSLCMGSLTLFAVFSLTRCRPSVEGLLVLHLSELTPLQCAVLSFLPSAVKSVVVTCEELQFHIFLFSSWFCALV